MVMVRGSLTSLVSINLTITIAAVESSRSIVAISSFVSVLASGAWAMWCRNFCTCLFVVRRNVWSTPLTLNKNSVSLLVSLNVV